MVSKAAQKRADDAIAAAIAQADRIVSLEDPAGKAAQAELLELLREADVNLAHRLTKITPKRDGSMRFSAAQAIAYRAQIGIVIEHVKAGTSGVAVGVGNEAIQKSAKAGAKLLAELEQEFKGVSISPSILASMQQSHVLRGPKAALVTRVATSVDRYGLQMGQQFSRIMQVGLLSGASNDQMVASLVGHGGPKGTVSMAAREVAPGVVERLREEEIPEGLFVRYRYWPERIVRTETAYAYSSTRFESLVQMQKDGLDVKKKIVATFDNRTAPDSVFVHGQVRELPDVFTDGAGRNYVHPPGRPNDRETIIPWFDDWAEVPSSEPPSPEAQARAAELAGEETTDPAARPHGAPPQSVEDLRRLEAEIAEAKRREQAASDQARAAIETEEAARRGAADVLLQHEIEDAAQASALVAKVEADIAAAKAAAKTDKQIDKVYKQVDKQLAGSTPALGTLRLYQLAGENPEHFAMLVNGLREVPLPLGAITGGIGDSHEVLDTLVKDAVGTIGSSQTLTEALTAWKKDPAFPGWLDELAGKKDAASKRLLASLVHSEQGLFLPPGGVVKANTWKRSLALAKKPATLAALKAKYAAPPPPKTWLVQSGGADYLDVFDPVTKEKKAWFKQVAGGFKVSPPAMLGGSWTERTFPDQNAAAAYAVDVSGAIQQYKIANAGALPTPTPKSTTSAARFNFVGQEPTTKLAPLPLSKNAAPDVKRRRAEARAHFAREGVKTRRVVMNARGESNVHVVPNAKNGVDEVLEHQGLTHAHNDWTGKNSGGWYGSSEGDRAWLSHFLTDDAAGEELARKVSRDLGSPSAKPEDFIAYARGKYAATQEALEARRTSLPIDADGYVTLYRGIKYEQAEGARQKRVSGKRVDVRVRPLSSWSSSRSSARVFTNGHNIVIQARVHYSRIFSQYEQVEAAMRRYGDGESEWIVINDAEHFFLDADDVTNGKAE